MNKDGLFINIHDDSKTVCSYQDILSELLGVIQEVELCDEEDEDCYFTDDVTGKSYKVVDKRPIEIDFDLSYRDERKEVMVGSKLLAEQEDHFVEVEYVWDEEDEDEDCFSCDGILYRML